MKKTLRVKPTVQGMEEVINFVATELALQNSSMRQERILKLIAETNIIIDEIFSNIIRYSGASEVVIKCDLTTSILFMQFWDNGKPYDPTKKETPDITLSAEEREIGGLGIFMVKQMVNCMEYKYLDGYNIVTIQKEMD